MIEIQIEQCFDYDALTAVWLASVKATHYFLSAEDLEFYRQRVPRIYMPNVRLYAVRNTEGRWCAFIGLGEDMVEMLFVSPEEMGKGYGSALLGFAIEEKGIGKVDVNEQNHCALDFYRKKGFSVIGRSETDGEGKSYPILHLKR